MAITKRDFGGMAQWAKSAQTDIPVPPVPGVAYRNTSQTAAEVESGQAYDKVFDSSRYNQFLYTVSGLVRLMEQHGILPYSELTEYAENGVCLGPDGSAYQALLPSGPGASGGAKPLENTTYWKKDPFQGDIAGMIAAHNASRDAHPNLIPPHNTAVDAHENRFGPLKQALDALKTTVDNMGNIEVPPVNPGGSVDLTPLYNAINALTGRVAALEARPVCPGSHEGGGAMAVETWYQLQGESATTTYPQTTAKTFDKVLASYENGAVKVLNYYTYDPNHGG